MDSNSTPTTTTTGGASATQKTPEMFRPPVNRAMRVLDRSFFRRTVPLSAATVFENNQIAKTRKRLDQSGELLNVPRIMPVRIAPDIATAAGKDAVHQRKEEKPFRAVGTGDQKRKCLLLDEKVRYDDTTTWSPTIQELVAARTVELGPYNLEIDYDIWSYYDIISSILPEDLEETPVGFTQVGHVAHLNLREQYFPYKYLIAEVLKDKSARVETVINKLDVIGAENEYRTFDYEVLAGSGDMNVVVDDQDCDFRFDYSKVYWNSRLNTEHTRLNQKFNEGEAVCDVMAGVGPFAIPAGKKRIFVWANDLNPHGYESMVSGIQRNKVGQFVTPFNMDGREFIRYATDELLKNPPAPVTIKAKISRGEAKRLREQSNVDQSATSPPAQSPPQKAQRSASPRSKIITCPSTFDHFVMNLPAIAIEFLDAFIGLYAGEESLFYPNTNRNLPMIHVYCFSTHSKDESIEHKDICNRISERIGFTISPEDRAGGSGDEERELEIHNVRLVAPNKQMFCASFRLPEEVAFAKKT